MQMPTAVTLDGRIVRLIPLHTAHAPGLYQAAQDPDIWRFMLSDPSVSPAAMLAWVQAAVSERERGAGVPFAILDRRDETMLGSTRLFDLRPADGALEIGYSWLARWARRTAVNTECKYLLLRYAFEELGAVRVQMKTDERNLVSQRAIERLGAVREGVLRSYQALADGTHRNTVMYSIIASEWPAVKASLERAQS